MQRTLVALLLLLSGMSFARADKALFKGYELYSYRTGPTWHYVLMMGTNRNKSLDEIAHARSMDLAQLKARIADMAVGESIFWFHRTIQGTGLHLEYPDKTVISDLLETARQDQVNLELPSSE